MEQIIKEVVTFLNCDFVGDKTKYLVLDHGQYEEDDYKNENAIFLKEGTVEFNSLEEFSVLADQKLITPKGHPFFSNMEIIKERTGCSIVCGESDGFGWLTAVLKTPKGMFTYG